MARKHGMVDVLWTTAEAAVYSPVWVIPAVLILEAFVPPADAWWYRYLKQIHDTPTKMYAVIGALVARPLI